MTVQHTSKTLDRPTLSSPMLRLLIEKTQDLSLVIDDDATVVEALHSGNFDARDVSGWVGLPLRSIVGPESIEKIDVLLSNDVSQPTSDPRWRHINLIGASKGFIPVLARYIALNYDAQETRVVILRDLRAQQAANDRFVEAQRELEFEYSERIRRLTPTSKALATPAAEGIPVEHVLEKIGKTSLDKVIAETTSALERRCLITILQEAGGRHNIAAKVAGMPLETWMDRVKRHKLV